MTIRILLVDDEESDIIQFKRAARKAGVQRRIEVRRSGRDALGLLASQTNQSPAEGEYLLVSDLNMPIMMGTELVARLRELGLAGLPAFILSSSDSIRDIEEALSSGANGYILKCVPEAEYLSAVRWLDGCCSCIDDGRIIDGGADCETGRPSPVVAGPVLYGAHH